MKVMDNFVKLVLLGIILVVGMVLNVIVKFRVGRVFFRIGFGEVVLVFMILFCEFRINFFFLK